MPKKILSTVSVVALSLAAAIGYLVYASGRADRAAADFCAGIARGSPIGDALARAARQGDVKRVVTLEKNEYRFEFQGRPFHVAVCAARTVDGKVVSTRVHGDGD